MGITSPLEPNLALVLGTSEVSLLELTSAYAVFPRGGIWIKPFGITEVLDRQERSLWRPSPVKQPVMSAETAAILTDMLAAVISEGTGRRALSLDRPLAGKTGTTDQFRDALFIGFSPSIALGVWVGFDDHGTLGTNETGAKAALPIWIHFMQEILPDRPYRQFDRPGGVLEVRMDAGSGLLAAPDCPEAVNAVFKKGTEPKAYCEHQTKAPWNSLR
jgi:penicillin-binding protein 1A